jgi:RNA polymerase sigma-70 factor (ECF subfamily)
MRKRAAETPAFEQFWRLHRPRVWRLAARLAGSVDLADDLTQEISLRAFQGFALFRGGAAGYTWLYRIAVNVVLRHRERLAPNTVPWESISHLPDPNLTPQAAVLQAEMRPLVWAALARLPDEQRTTIILSVYEELKYREIAAVLEIPLGTVKSRLHIGMARLREELKDAL